MYAKEGYLQCFSCIDTISLTFRLHFCAQQREEKIPHGHCRGII